MPAAEILRIMMTTGAIQLLCDLSSYYLIFSKPAYQEAVERAERAQTTVTFWKNKKAQQSSNSSKSKKARLEQAEEDAAERMAFTSRFHIWPQIGLAVAFLCVTKILGTDMGQQVIGIVPFTPPSLLQRWWTARGLEWTTTTEADFSPAVTNVGQACSWIMIYVLSGISIKFYVHKIFGTSAPAGNNFLMNMAETKQGKKMLKSAGIDPNDLKIE